MNRILILALVFAMSGAVWGEGSPPGAITHEVDAPESTDQGAPAVTPISTGPEGRRNQMLSNPNNFSPSDLAEELPNLTPEQRDKLLDRVKESPAGKQRLADIASDLTHSFTADDKNLAAAVTAISAAYEDPSQFFDKFIGGLTTEKKEALMRGLVEKDPDVQAAQKTISNRNNRGLTDIQEKLEKVKEELKKPDLPQNRKEFLQKKQAALAEQGGRVFSEIASKATSDLKTKYPNPTAAEIKDEVERARKNVTDPRAAAERAGVEAWARSALSAETLRGREARAQALDARGTALAGAEKGDLAKSTASFETAAAIRAEVAAKKALADVLGSSLTGGESAKGAVTSATDRKMKADAALREETASFDATLHEVIANDAPRDPKDSIPQETKDKLATASDKLRQAEREQSLAQQNFASAQAIQELESAAADYKPRPAAPAAAPATAPAAAKLPIKQLSRAPKKIVSRDGIPVRPGDGQVYELPNNMGEVALYGRTVTDSAGKSVELLEVSGRVNGLFPASALGITVQPDRSLAFDPNLTTTVSSGGSGSSTAVPVISTSSGRNARVGEGDRHTFYSPHRYNGRQPFRSSRQRIFIWRR